MITMTGLLDLLQDLESDRVERTQGTADTDKFSEAVCAFANDFPNHRKPGYLVIGVDNQGKPVGLTIGDQLLTKLGGLRSDGNIQPLPAISVGKFQLDGGDVAVVEVVPSDLPPVRYKGRVWIRIGPRKATASEQEERILSDRRISLARNFDAMPCSEAALDDLSSRLFQEYRQEQVDAEVIEQNHRTLEEQLASFRLFDLRKSCPTFAGILLFGTNPRFFLPGAYVQFLQLPGTVLTDAPLDQAEYSGDLRTMLEQTHAKFRALNATRMVPNEADPARERLVPDVPEVAFRELFHNAILHRDYQSNTPVRVYWFSDRIEIHSPGGLFGEVEPGTIERSSSYRNPVLAEAMKALGFVNRFGYGIQRANAELEKNGNGRALFEINRTVSVAIPRRHRT